MVLGDLCERKKVTTNENNGIYKQEQGESLKVKPLSNCLAMILSFFSLFLRYEKKGGEKKTSYWIPSHCSLLFEYKCITESNSDEINFLLSPSHLLHS